MAEDSATVNDGQQPPEQPSYDGHFSCVCGKIRIDVIQPKSSNLVPPTAALCQCTDCYQYSKAVANYRQEHCPSSLPEKADALTAANAVDMRQIYKSDAVKLTGEEHLHAVKLTKESPAIRYYSTCCGTPLFMEYTMAPFFLVFQHTIATTSADDNNNGETALFQRIPPPVVLNHKSAPEGSAPTPEGIQVSDGVSIKFISHALARAVFGLLGGKKQSPIAAQLEKVPVSVGMDQIGKPKQESNTAS